MRKVQGANFGVRFYRRPGAKTPVRETAKKTPQEEPVMKDESTIKTGIPAQSRQLWHSMWVDVEAKTQMPTALAVFTRAVSDAAKLVYKEAKPVPVAQTTGPTEDDQAVLREIAAMARAAYEKALGPKVDPKEELLWGAARKGDCYKIRLLVMDGVDLDARDAQGRTAINIAAQYNQQQAMKTLLAAKEMRYMAQIGDLPQTKFFSKFAKTGS